MLEPSENDTQIVNVLQLEAIKLSISWSYDAYMLNKNVSLRQHTRSVVEIFQEFGYVPGKNKYLQRIELHTGNPYNYYEGISLDKTLELIEKHGGGFDFYKNDDSIFVSFSQQLEIKHADKKGSLGIIGLGQPGGAFRYDMPEDEKLSIAKDLKEIFFEICRQFNADFGYSTNDQISDEFSAMKPQWQVHDDIANKRMPSFVNWLNYFSREYYDSIQNGIFNDIPCKIQEIDQTGVVVSIFDYPWEAGGEGIVNFNRKYWIQQ